MIGRLIEAVTFRNYEYESDRNMADIKVPKITVDEHANAGTSQKKLKRTVEEINAQIRSITDELVEEFEKNLSYAIRGPAADMHGIIIIRST